ncbi:MAG: diguanylate cyclase (GGDEF)-like protein/PAS domain S-box-containing protein [Kiritimatiellia bacterium]|jgi:diguanylate cyclase (GGDEF)-like protein/PAS domain S-box-containing protein
MRAKINRTSFKYYMKKSPSIRERHLPEDLASIIASAPVGMVVSNEKGEFEYVNTALMTMLGYSGNEIYQPDVIISHPEEYQNNQKLREELAAHPDQPVIMEKRYLHKNGHVILGLVSMIALRNADNSIKCLVAQVININEQRKTETSANLFRSMINSSRETMFIIDPRSGQILDSNIKGCQSLGYSYQEMLSLKIFDIDLNITEEYEWDKIIATIRNTKSTLLDGIHRRKNNHTFPVEMSVSYVEIDGTDYILALSRDVQERRNAEELIWKQANYDPLTKLPNRHMLYDRLSKIIKNANFKNTSFAVLCLDLDKFKEVNDTLGHYIGDKLLIETGKRIKTVTRDGDTIARLGGDEFCLLINCNENAPNIAQISNKILTTLAEPFVIGSHKIFTSISIGISFFPSDAQDVDSLLKQSDQAMYAAKENGRNCCQYFTTSMQEEAFDRMELSRDLHFALQENQFYIEYQPIFSIGDSEEKIAHKAEALIRWQHPERGLVNPTDFIPIAEANGTIDAIGDWLFLEILQQIHYWQATYQHKIQISINASPLYFREGNEILNRWQKKLQATDLPADSVIIEITEGLLLDTAEHVTHQLLMLYNSGIQVALDDFGTGYSSLAYLKKLEIDYLKIDKSFIDNLKPNSNEEALCEAIIVMAHKLQLQVIAEGIETEEQYALLKTYGCDYAQGFLLSRPTSAKKIEAFFIGS